MTNIESYNYKLPKNLIANEPILPKNQAKLLVYQRVSNKIIHTNFFNFFNFVPNDCLIILNDTKVLKARIFGQKQSGSKIELLYHNALDSNNFIVQIKGRVKINDEINFKNNLKARIIKLLDNGLRVVSFSQNNKILDKNELIETLNLIGHIPLPPYIKREDSKSDILNYQSVFAKNIGSIAAPTASLHFSDSDLEKIKKMQHCFITLHIGAGTFFNVESKNIQNHKIHKEDFYISQDSKNKIDSAKKILCIGTTACRCVEFYNQIKQINGKCDIFINPLNPPKITNYLLTNFHLPKSTLIMLVAGFIGLEKTLEIYEIAKNMEYRFYSYGDGMLIL